MEVYNNIIDILTITMMDFINFMDFNKDKLNNLSLDTVNSIIRDELEEDHLLIKTFLSMAKNLNLTLPNINDYYVLDNVFLKINQRTLYNFRFEYLKVIKFIKGKKYIEIFKQLEIATSQILDQDDSYLEDDNESLS